MPEGLLESDLLPETTREYYEDELEMHTCPHCQKHYFRVKAFRLGYMGLFGGGSIPELCRECKKIDKKEGTKFSIPFADGD